MNADDPRASATYSVLVCRIIKILLASKCCLRCSQCLHYFLIAFVGNWVYYGTSINLAPNVGLGRIGDDTSNVMCILTAVKKYVTHELL